FGFIDHAIAGLPETHAVVGFFVIRRHERFVESPELPEKLAAGKQKSSRTIVNVATKHVGRRSWLVASPVTARRAIAPDDRASFLKGAVGQDEASTNSAYVRASIKHTSRRLETTRKQLRIVVQQENISAPCLLRGLVHGLQESQICFVPQHGCAHDFAQQLLGPIRGAIVCDNYVDADGRVTETFDNRREAAERERRLIVKHENNRDVRTLRAR